MRNPEIFRSDLFYRMSLCLSIPPLRERLEDLDSFISYFGNMYIAETKASLVMRDDTLGYLKDIVGLEIFANYRGLIEQDRFFEAIRNYPLYKKIRDIK